MMEVKQNTPVDFNDLMNTNSDNSSDDLLVINDLDTSKLKENLRKTSEISKNGLLSDVKNGNIKNNKHDLNDPMDKRLSDKTDKLLETENKLSTSGGKVRDLGDDLDKLLSKINDIVEDRGDKKKDVVETGELEKNLEPEKSLKTNGSVTEDVGNEISNEKENNIDTEKNDIEVPETNTEDVEEKNDNLDDVMETNNKNEVVELDTSLEGQEEDAIEDILRESTKKVMEIKDDEKKDSTTDDDKDKKLTEEEENSRKQSTSSNSTAKSTEIDEVVHDSDVKEEVEIDSNKEASNAKSAELGATNENEILTLTVDSDDEEDNATSKNNENAEETEETNENEGPVTEKNATEPDGLDLDDSNDDIVFFEEKSDSKTDTETIDKNENIEGESEDKEELKENDKKSAVDNNEKAPEDSDDDVILLDDDDDDDDNVLSKKESEKLTEDNTEANLLEDGAENSKEDDKSLTVNAGENKEEEEEKIATAVDDVSAEEEKDKVLDETKEAEAEEVVKETEETNSDTESAVKTSETDGGEIKSCNIFDGETVDLSDDEEENNAIIDSKTDDVDKATEENKDKVEIDEVAPPVKRLRLSNDVEQQESTKETKVDTASATDTKVSLVDDEASTKQSTAEQVAGTKRTHDTIADSEDEKQPVEEAVKRAKTDKLLETAIVDDNDDDAQIIETPAKFNAIASDTPIPLYPPPIFNENAPKISLDYFKRFRRTFDKMTKHDLEELVLQKIVETIVHRSEFAEMREIIEKQEKIIVSHRNKITELSKQFRDLEMVHQRVIKDIELKNSQFLLPVKITRAVGLQVNIPHRKNIDIGSAQPGANANAPNAGQRQSPNLYAKNVADASTAMTRLPASSPMASVGPAAGANVRRNSQKVGQQRSMDGSSYRPNTNSPSAGPLAAANAPKILNKNVAAATVSPMVRPRYPGVNLAEQQRLRQPITQPPVNNVRKLRPITPNSSQQQQQSSQRSTTPVGKNGPDGYMNSLNHLSSSFAPSVSITPAQRKTDDSLIDLTDEDGPGAAAAAAAAAVASRNQMSSTPPAMQKRISVQLTSTSYMQQHQQRGVPPLTRMPSGGNQMGSGKMPVTRQMPNMQCASAAASADKDIPIEAQTWRHIPMNIRATAENNFQTSRECHVCAKDQIRSSTTWECAKCKISLHVPYCFTQYHTQKSSQHSAICTPPGTSITRVPSGGSMTQRVKYVHPAPLPITPPQAFNPIWKLPPPRPTIRISNLANGIVISWTMEESMDRHAECVSYQIYAYQETSTPPMTESWRHVGDVKAMLLPMAVTLTQFQEGQRYYFAVRAVDTHQRYGPFSLPKTWS